MDQQLKARLIGGAVLVTLIVLLVPELLSGRKSSETEPAAVAGTRGTRTFTIELGSGSPATVTPQAAPQSPPAQPVGDAQPAAAPEPKPEVKPDAKPEGKPETTSVPGPAVVSPPAAPEPASKPAATARGGWSVQVGAFGSADTARKLVKDLERSGFDAYVAPVPRAGKTLHRVRVGPVADRAEADRLAARLKARNLPATVVAND
jgi:cell division septation protein DedD